MEINRSTTLEYCHGNQQASQIDKRTMNLGLVGLHEEMKNLSRRPPILLLAVSMAAW
jgi:hypothetical protein